MLQRYLNHTRVMSDGVSQLELERRAIKCLSLLCKDEVLKYLFQLQEGMMSISFEELAFGFGLIGCQII